jgi:hypothetical protein
MACRDCPLETAKLNRVIFDLNRETFDPLPLWDSLGHSPALQDSVSLKSEIEMVRAGMMFLNHESRHAAEPIIEKSRFRLKTKQKFSDERQAKHIGFYAGPGFRCQNEKGLGAGFTLRNGSMPFGYVGTSSFKKATESGILCEP